MVDSERAKKRLRNENGKENGGSRWSNIMDRARKYASRLDIRPEDLEDEE